MKHPVRSDFDTAVTEAGISVTFKPANSTYSFLMLTGTNEVARLGLVSSAGVRHAEQNIGDYAPEEVQEMAQRPASEFAESVWPVQSKSETEKQTLVTPDYRKLQDP